MIYNKTIKTNKININNLSEIFNYYLFYLNIDIYKLIKIQFDKFKIFKSTCAWLIKTWNVRYYPDGRSNRYETI